MRLAFKQLPGTNEARMRITFDLTVEPGAVFITLQHMPEIPSAIFDQGVWVRSSSFHRQSPDVKSTNFLVDTQTERRKLPEDVYELIMVDERGRILEGLTSNFFAVRSGTIYTARENVLSGVTRQAILDLANSAGLPILLEPFSMAAVEQLDEAFITSSSRGVVPVVRIDNCTIGSGQPGSITQKLSTAYKRYILQAAEEI
jgi:branched-chain amino acid aminotransferase